MAQLGKVTHYYDKLGVAIVKLTKKVKTGDTVRFGSEENGFKQEVSSMQLDHKPISEAKSGDEIGIKADKKVKVGIPVYSA